MCVPVETNGSVLSMSHRMYIVTAISASMEQPTKAGFAPKAM